jgi:UDP-N-acetylglucosamine acyltransferase
MSIHPTAVVEDGAKLGAGVEIGPWCKVGREASLGEGVRLLSHVVVTGRTDIGARCEVHPHTVLGGAPQIRGGGEPDTRLTIGEDCVIRENVTMHRGSPKSGGHTTIGARGYFMIGSHVGHDCHVGDDVTLVNNALLAGHVDIGNNVLLGGGAAVQQYGRIGRGAFLSGLSGCALDIIPFGEAIGLHARLGGLNLIGMKRAGIPRANIHAVRAAFKAIFLEGAGSFADKARQAASKWPDVPEVQEICAFILAPAKRRIAPARRHRDDGDDSDE